MRHGSLFSGLGGFDLAARWCGWTNVFQCEIEPFCQKILKQHFPECKLFTDIKKTDFKKYNGKIDIISGGFPCQPFSVAGKRKGTEDDRFLWEEMLRAVCEVSPSWVVAENVSGLLSQQQGVVFERVCSDLEVEGYEVQPFIIPACAIGAPHRRDRVWIVANRANSGIKNVQCERKDGIYEFGITSNTSYNGRSTWRTNSEIKECNKEERTDVFCEPERFSEEQIVTNAKSTGQQSSENRQGKIKLRGDLPKWDKFPTQSPICIRNDGISDILDGITFPAWRRKSIEAYGNAIVPQVAYQIFKAIEYTEINKIEGYEQN
jgi:DNA (cytosine-5)-methyltransferase 1